MLIKSANSWCDFQWVLDPLPLIQTLADLAWPEEVVTCLKDKVEELGAKSEESQRFLEYTYNWYKGEVDELADPELSCWHALAVVAAFPLLFEYHRHRGIPWQITVDTLRDVPRRMLNFRETYGFWGFDAQKWLRNHVRGRIYQIGRLQYLPGDFFYPARVYQTEEGLIAFAREGVRCEADGWIRKNTESAEAWTTVLRESEGKLWGHRIEWDGRVCRQLTSLSWPTPVILHEGCKVLHVHIPMGEKLEVSDCRSSIEQAFAFFHQYFPEHHYVAACCGSWLLDRAFASILPETSNIVEFGKLFRPLPHPDASEDSHYRWIFGKGVDRERACTSPAKTKLQSAVIDHLKEGGELHNSAGFVLNPERGQGHELSV